MLPRLREDRFTDTTRIALTGNTS